MIRLRAEKWPYLATKGIMSWQWEVIEKEHTFSRLLVLLLTTGVVLKVEIIGVEIGKVIELNAVHLKKKVHI